MGYLAPAVSGQGSGDSPVRHPLTHLQHVLTYIISVTLIMIL